MREWHDGSIINILIHRLREAHAIHDIKMSENEDILMSATPFRKLKLEK